MSLSSLTSTRVLLALTLAAVSGGAATLLGATHEVAAVMFVVNAAAILIVGYRKPDVEPPPQPLDQVAPAAHALDPVLDAVAEPLLLVQDGRVAHANRAAIRLLGNHIGGRDLRLAIRHPASAELLRLPHDQEVTLILDDFGKPDERWLLRACPIDGNGRMVQLVDRTAAHAAERMRVDFVANASHELRTPLAAVLGFVETLQDDDTAADTATRHRFLEIIDKEGRRMLRLVEDLLSLSRIESERHRPPSERIDLGALVETVRAVVATRMGERGEDLRIERIGDAMIVGDTPELTQLIQNLMINALKYGASGTPVIVGVTGQDRVVVLSVEDRGEGIPAEHIPRLTERFYRVDPGRSRAVGGTGLGLAIVKHIVERHRGKLEIASQVGQGTIVTVRLPREIASGVMKLSR